MIYDGWMVALISRDSRERDGGMEADNPSRYNHAEGDSNSGGDRVGEGEGEGEGEGDRQKHSTFEREREEMMKR